MVHYFKIKNDYPLVSVSFSFLMYGASIVFFLFSARLEGFSKRIIKWLVPLGSISYGLYIVHFPLLCAILFSHKSFSGTPLTYITRLIVFLVASFSAAYLLEKKFQPLVKRLIG